MLPLWRNQLCVVLCPDRVILIGWGKGLRPKVMFQTTLSCIPLSDVPNWQSALDAFVYWLGNNEIGRANVNVVLSNHFVRYALLPYSADVTGRAEEQAMARIVFEGIYGELAKQWQFRIADGGYGETRLIAAADMSLLERVSDILAPSALSLTTITPYFVSAFNRFSGQMQAHDGLFALVEEGLMVVISFKNAQMSCVRRVSLSGELERVLPNLLHREILISGLDMESAPIYLHVEGRPDFILQAVDGLSIHVLRQTSSVPFFEDARFDMAIVGRWI